MAVRILHLLSQRPGQTGSGVTLETLVRHAAAAGYEQRVVVGVPAHQRDFAVGGLERSRIHPLYFGTGTLDFAVPGMSDVMPYASSVWSQLGAGQLVAYRHAWREHLTALIESFRPQLIHAHHIWLMSSMLRDLAPDTPIVLQCHGTGLRQMELCAHLADEVARGCARADRFQVLRDDHAELLAHSLGVARERIHVVPAGYREDIFNADGREESGAARLLYVGKYSAAKGLPELLDAIERLPGVELHVAGEGAGPEAEGLRRRMSAMDSVTLHGQLDQPALAELMRRAAVCVLPSYYEGVPLVLVEAAACGCKVVATALPGVTRELAPRLGGRLTLVEPPPMIGIDTPDPAGRAPFAARLAEALRRTLEAPYASAELEPFGYRRVFGQVERIWRDLLGDELQGT